MEVVPTELLTPDHIPFKLNPRCDGHGEWLGDYEISDLGRFFLHAWYSRDMKYKQCSSTLLSRRRREWLRYLFYLNNQSKECTLENIIMCLPDYVFVAVSSHTNGKTLRSSLIRLSNPLLQCIAGHGSISLTRMCQSIVDDMIPHRFTKSIAPTAIEPETQTASEAREHTYCKLIVDDMAKNAGTYISDPKIAFLVSLSCTLCTAKHSSETFHVAPSFTISEYMSIHIGRSPNSTIHIDIQNNTIHLQSGIKLSLPETFIQHWSHADLGLDTEGPLLAQHSRSGISQILRRAWEASRREMVQAGSIPHCWRIPAGINIARYVHDKCLLGAVRRSKAMFRSIMGRQAAC